MVDTWMTKSRDLQACFKNTQWLALFKVKLIFLSICKMHYVLQRDSCIYHAFSLPLFYCQRRYKWSVVYSFELIWARIHDKWELSQRDSIPFGSVVSSSFSPVISFGLTIGWLMAGCCHCFLFANALFCLLVAWPTFVLWCYLCSIICGGGRCYCWPCGVVLRWSDVFVGLCQPPMSHLLLYVDCVFLLLVLSLSVCRRLCSVVYWNWRIFYAWGFPFVLLVLVYGATNMNRLVNLVRL